MTATALLDLQSRFQQHLLGHGDASAEIEGPAPRRALGLGIYAHAYRQRLLDTLADAHEKTNAAMGSDTFSALALHYIAQHPPTTRSLRWYGAGFAAHLRLQHPPDRPDQAAFAELAELDWALRGAFDAPDAAVLQGDTLAALPPDAWGALRLTLVPAQFLRFEHNTVAVWQALDDGLAPPATARGAVAVEWLVWRKALQPHFRSLHPLEAALLRALQAGLSFAQACADAVEGLTPPDATLDATAFIGASLRQWLEDGLLSGVVLAAGPR